MPSPDLLPRGRSFPDAAAPPLDGVLSRARRRRTQRVAFVSVLTVAAVTVTAFAVVPHSSSRSLDVVTPAVRGTTASPPSHAPAVSVVPPVPLHVTTGRVTGRSSAHGATPAQHKTTSRTTSTANTPETTTRPATGRPIVGPAHRMTGYDPRQGCTGNGPNATTGWCSYYDGATSGTAGHLVTLATAVCRLPGQSTGTLTGNGHEADFSVGRNAYPPSWGWAHGRTFSKAPTSIRVPAGSCVDWFVSWRVVTNAGKPLPSGQYYLMAWPDMSPANGYASAQTQNNVSFTVR